MSATPAPVEILVISGPVGVGKSATAYEVSHQLQAAGIGHALLDSDEPQAPAAR